MQEEQRRSDKPILLVPQVFVWSKRPDEARYGVFDASGRRIVGVDSGVQVAGPHILAIDAESLGLPLLLSGVYFLRIEAGGDAVTRRVVVIR